MVGTRQTSMAVRYARVGDEEMKFLLDAKGRIARIGKNLAKSPGEAVGVNRFQARNLPRFIRAIEACREQDWFERGIELAIRKGIRVAPWTSPISCASRSISPKT